VFKVRFEHKCWVDTHFTYLLRRKYSGLIPKILLNEKWRFLWNPYESRSYSSHGLLLIYLKSCFHAERFFKMIFEIFWNESYFFMLFLVSLRQVREINLIGCSFTPLLSHIIGDISVDFGWILNHFHELSQPS